jgi:hypothetical protein
MKLLTGGFSLFRPEKGKLVMGATFIATFLITFCVLLIQRKSDAPLTEANGTAPSLTRPDRRMPSTPLLASRPQGAPQSASVPPIREAVAPVTYVDTARADASPLSAELPVDINFRHRRDSDTYLEGSVFNKSSVDLQIEVDFFSPRTKRTSKIELTVPAAHSSDFGRDDGLEIEGGDDLTIKSLAFADKQMQVR